MATEKAEAMSDVMESKSSEIHRMSEALGFNWSGHALTLLLVSTRQGSYSEQGDVSDESETGEHDGTE